MEEITNWQCEFHGLQNPSQDKVDQSGSEPKNFANILCPPLEAFSGHQSRFLVNFCPNGNPEFRRAIGLPIALYGEPPSVLVIVDANSQTAQSLNPSQHGQEQYSLHDLLNLIRSEMNFDHGFDPLLGDSPVARRVRRQVQAIAEHRAECLLIGPVGSGRRQIAETIHYSSGELTSPLIPIKAELCDPELIQSTIRELFSTKESESAKEQGKLLLLNSERLDEPSQIELREFLGMADFSLEIIATASCSLIDLAEQGGFDRELAFRLSSFEIYLRSLRERQADLPVLIQSQIEKFNAEGGRQVGGANKPAMQLLLDYHWPGEFEELVEVIESSCSSATGPNIVKADLPKRLIQAESAREVSPRDSEKIDLPQFLQEVETELIRRAVRVAKGNKTEAASLLNLSRASLLRRWNLIEEKDG